MRRFPSLRLVVCLLFIACAASVRVWAAGYPTSRDPFVNDFAGLLTPGDVQQTRALLSALKTEHGIEAVIVTIASRSRYPTGDASIESFATNLFNSWGIGDRARNDGVLILVASDDHELRIELGDGYGAAMARRMKSVIDDQMVPQFRVGRMSAGIVAGARAVARIVGDARNGSPRAAAPSAATTTSAAIPLAGIETTPPTGAPTAEAPIAETVLAEAPPGAPVATPTPRATPRPASVNRPAPAYHAPRGHSSSIRKTGAVAATLAIAAVMGAVALGVAAMAIANRRRRCPNCKIEMTLLDETADDMFLDNGQRLEEALQSVNYAVWNCPACGLRLIDRASRWFSSHSPCPACSYKTLATTYQTIMPPTYVSTGLKRVSSSCRHCGHQREHTVILPQLTRSDHHHRGGMAGSLMGGFHSSGSHSGGHRSSGSFGGGHSSGRGASGRW